MLKSILDCTQTACYIDPGTGSLIIQVLIAFFLGGLFTLRVYWKKFKAFFTRKKDE